jgi:(p)ppGpp synthase/HD superfamily hydrolase
MADLLTRVGQFVKERYQDDPDELNHVRDVSAMAQTLDDQVVALLHDLVEDSFASWEEVADILGTESDRLLPALQRENLRPLRSSIAI